MKKMILGFCALVLLGAGCTTPGSTVEGDWFLAFDMPDEWVMVEHYKMGSEAMSLEEGVNLEIFDVVIQSTDMGVYTSSGYMPEDSQLEEIGGVVTENFTYIRVLKIDSRRVVPSEAEDLGNGFYKEQLCEDGGECQIGGQSNYQYYFVTEDAKYQFMITQRDQDLEVAEGVILSARETVVDEVE